jgi:hypothetical protein
MGSAIIDGPPKAPSRTERGYPGLTTAPAYSAGKAKFVVSH